MSYQFKQTLVMIRADLGSLPRRTWISLSMVFSVALVVCVLVGFLAMARGFEIALAGAGSPTIAVILGGGTNQEIGSDVPASAIRTLKATRDDIGVSRDPEGRAFGLAGRTAIGLCRCGQSANKPFCDGAHRACGFADTVAARELPPPKPKV